MRKAAAKTLQLALTHHGMEVRPHLPALIPILLKKDRESVVQVEKLWCLVKIVDVLANDADDGVVDGKKKRKSVGSQSIRGFVPFMSLKRVEGRRWGGAMPRSITTTYQSQQFSSPTTNPRHLQL